MRRVVAMVSIVVGLAAGCAGGAPEVPAEPDGGTDPVLVRGRDLYSGLCAGCHAGDGGGNLGPKLADGVVVEAYPDIADQISVVSEGRDQMPSFSGALTDDEIEAVVRYTREVL